MSDNLLDPDEISSVARFEISVRGEVEGFLVGTHRSPYRGFSAEFSEHRAYYPGDDLRWLNWKLLARMDRAYVKVFQEETNLRAYLMVDVSRSMAYGNKLRYGARLAGALAYLLHLQRDAVGLVCFSDRVHTVIPPGSSRLHLRRVMSELATLEAEGTTQPGRAFLELAGAAKRRGLIVVISDLMADTDDVIRGIRAFRARKHHTMVFHLLHPDELTGPDRPGLYRDMETGERVVFHPAAASYQRSVSSWRKSIEAGLRDAGAEFHEISTDTPLAAALTSLAEKRRRLP